MRYLLIAWILFNGGVSAAPIETLQSGEWGTYSFFHPDGDFHGLAFLFSPAGGIGRDDLAAAYQLAGRGWATALVDSGEYLKRLASSDKTDKPGDCVYLPGAVEWTSEFLQHRLDRDDYRPPFLAGREQGSALVFALLSQGHPGSFAAGLSWDFTPRLATRRGLCERPAASRSTEGQFLDPAAALSARWFPVHGHAPTQEAASAFIEQAGRAQAGRVQAVEQTADYANTILRIAEQAPPVQADQGLHELPLVEVSDRSAKGVLAVIYSGDGGWRDIDKSLGDYLAKQDLAVVGVDALRYFWKRQTPDRVGQDLTRILGHYLAAWKLNKVWLIGYSFGADILPFAYNRLPDALRARVVQISLLSPSLTTDFEVHVSGWFGGVPGSGARPILPELAAIPGSKVQCVYGVDEAADSLCALGAKPAMEIISSSGGHHFDGDYQALGLKLLAGLVRRLATDRDKEP